MSCSTCAKVRRALPRPVRRIVERVLPPLIPAAERISPQALIDAARVYVGVPYRHQGRTRLGLDCIGLVTLAIHDAGLDLFAVSGLTDDRHYARRPSADFLRQVTHAATALAEPIPGALLLFRWPQVPHPQHCALYTERGTMIHAMLRLRHVREHTLGPPWTQRLHSAWAIPGVRYG